MFKIKVVGQEGYGEYYEWFCPNCNKAYHQSKKFGDVEMFKEWIKEHLKRDAGS